MIKTFIVSMGMLLSLQSMADLNGTWLGSGEWKSTDNTARCSSVRLEFKEESVSLSRISGSLNCDVMDMIMPKLSFEKKGNDLIRNNAIFGNIEGNNYSWAEVYQNNVKVRISISRNADQIVYDETWLDANFPTPDHVLYEIHAKLMIQCETVPVTSDRE